MSEKQLTAHDMELLSCAGIYVEPQTLSGPALVFPISDGEGGEIRVLWQGGAYESATYSWYFLILNCMTCCLKLPVLYTQF